MKIFHGPDVVIRGVIFSSIQVAILEGQRFYQHAAGGITSILGAGEGVDDQPKQRCFSPCEEKTKKHPYQKRKMLFKGPTKVPERECFKSLPTELDHHVFTSQIIIFRPRLFPSLPPIQLWTKVSHLGESMTPPPSAGFLPPTSRSRDVAEVKSKILIIKIDWTF